VSPTAVDPRIGFHLDEATHIYTYRGRAIPGLSFLLKWHRYVDPTYYTERGREIGNATHLATAFLDKGTLDWESIKDDEVLGRILAYERFKRELAFEPTEIEQIHAHAGGLYGCKIDRRGKMRGVSDLILEIKGGAKAPWHLIQTGMQRRAVPGGPRRFCLYLHPDETYHLDTEHTDPDDEQTGVNLASDYHWRIRHGYR
jgi:hypothetical protein